MKLDHARRLLTSELAELDDRARFAADSQADQAEQVGDGIRGQHPGDQGTDVAGVMDAELLTETVAGQRRAVQEALGRLDDGSYGRCAVCSEQIDDDRLEARPEASTCRAHADAVVGP